MSESVLFAAPLERLLVLHTLPLFATLEPEPLGAVALHAKERFVRRDAPLWSEGAGHNALVVLDGALELEHGGRRRKLAPGDTAGLLEMWAGVDPRPSGRAVTDALVLELDRQAQLDVCEEHFPVFLAYLSWLAARFLDSGAVPLPPGATVAGRLPSSDSVPSAGRRVARALTLWSAVPLHLASPDALFELAEHVTDLYLPAGRSLWEGGTPADWCAVVTGGSVTVDDGERRAGSTLGFAELLAGRLRPHGCAAGADGASILRVERERVLDILEDHFDTAERLAAWFARAALAAAPST